jgi:hypothetical protein
MWLNLRESLFFLHKVYHNMTCLVKLPFTRLAAFILYASHFIFGDCELAFELFQPHLTI